MVHIFRSPTPVAGLVLGAVTLLAGCAPLPDANLGSGSNTDTVTDVDGNIYRTVTLGGQMWMAENLAVTRMNDGSEIAEYAFGQNWNGGGLPRFQWADTTDLMGLHDDELPNNFYGAMYNDFALAHSALAPEGWRLPSEEDFLALGEFLASLGHAEDEAAALKTTSGWFEGSGNGTDLYGFSGLPAGYVASTGSATGAGVISTWATSWVDAKAQVRRTANLHDSARLEYADNSILLGAAVRCIRN